MTYLEQLKENHQGLERIGVMDWKLKDEIKNLEDIKMIFQKLFKKFATNF